MQGGRGKIWLSVLLTFLIGWWANGQEVRMKGGFVEDSLLIGKDVSFWMAATYPPDLEMVFPDSLFNFSPFEFSFKTFFETKLKDGLAYDSTVYTIQSFEIDKVQYLKLPAFILHAEDSTLLETDLDSIYLTELAPIVSDSTRLKENLAYQSVATAFNYPLLYYILGGLAIIVIVLLIIFGKRIMRWFKLLKLRKRYEQFNTVFEDYIKKLKVDPDPILAENALVFWKNYQQQLENAPFSVLTTKEILTVGYTSELEPPLKSIDRVVYGKKTQEDIYQEFQSLEGFTKERYSRKIEEVKNGK